jgi:hypothetical protein
LSCKHLPWGQHIGESHWTTWVRKLPALRRHQLDPCHLKCGPQTSSSTAKGLFRSVGSLPTSQNPDLWIQSCILAGFPSGSFEP